MPDYGHEIEVGIFPTPRADRVEQVAALAELADVSGIELVTVQDHPYQATYVDSWTLLSHLAATTTSVRLALNVASLPLRQPVVLAKSMATLDLLSGGRVELGLGAGAFWDAIAAAGGPRRTPKQAVDALVEAIAVIRGMWAGGSLSVAGEHYRVKGLHAGPAPAHRVPIWLGAYGPRMLRITGELADAWVPTMGYADLPDLPAMNARIDEASTAAGRGPELIRRIYNIVGRFGSGSGFLTGTPSDWAEQLAQLACEQGFSVFILGTDDPDIVRRFGAEVAPRLRELVAQERAGRAATTTPVTATSAATTPGASAAVAPPTQVAPPTAAAPDDGRAPLGVLPMADHPHRLTTTEQRAQIGWHDDDRPGVPAPADARYTAPEQAAAQHLVDRHDTLRADLEQVRGILQQVEESRDGAVAGRTGTPTAAARQRDWALGAYCSSYARSVAGHHAWEETSVFTHLRGRDQALVPVLDRLEHEHELLAGVLDGVDAALVALVGAGAGGKDAALESVGRELDLLTDTLLSHLAYEERELLHPIARYGTA